jgi:hypothetical protein
MVHWHARTLADLSGKLEPDATDVLLAIRLTERYYTGHQPNFISVFTGHGVFSHLHKLVLG